MNHKRERILPMYIFIVWIFIHLPISLVSREGQQWVPIEVVIVEEIQIEFRSQRYFLLIQASGNTRYLADTDGDC